MVVMGVMVAMVVLVAMVVMVVMVVMVAMVAMVANGRYGRYGYYGCYRQRPSYVKPKGIIRLPAGVIYWTVPFDNTLGYGFRENARCC